MIRVTRLNDKEIIINHNLIECLESNPDTTITMTNGRKYIAKESVDEVINEIIEYSKKLLTD